MSEKVVSALVAPRREWSVMLNGGGHSLLAKVGIAIGPIPLYKRVRLEVGASAAALRDDRVMLPVSWTAVGGPPLFPKMEGTLHAEPDGPGRTKLTLNARYDPPFGVVGKVIDVAVMHRAAQITMTDFVDRLAVALMKEIRKAS